MTVEDVGPEAMTDVVEGLSKGSLLGSLDRSAALDLLARSSVRRAGAGDVLIRQGELGDTAYLILDGEFEVVTETALGQVAVATLGPQEIVGEGAVFSHGPRSATVRALTPARVLSLRASDLQAVLTQHPAAALRLLGALGRRVAALNRPLSMLTLAAQALEAEVDVASLSTLLSEAETTGPFAQSFRKLVLELEAKHSRRQEMLVAARLQQSILPRPLDFQRRKAPFRVAALMRPSRDIGGDFYDFFFSEDDARAFFIVADVSGKGVPAALFMAVSRTLLRATVLAAPSLELAVARANTQLEGDNPECLFVTVFIAELNIATAELRYVNAGHNDGFLVRSDGGLHLLPRTAPALGLMPEAKFRSGVVVLEPGDRLVLVTDGVTEAFSASEEEFGETRLAELLPSHAGGAPEEVVAAVDRAVTTFAKGCLQSDDLTCLTLAYL